MSQEQANKIVAQSKSQTAKSSKKVSSARAFSQNKVSGLKSTFSKFANKYEADELGGIGYFEEDMGGQTLAERHEDLYGTTEYAPKTLLNAKVTKYGFIADAPADVVRKDVTKVIQENSIDGNEEDLEFSDKVYDLGGGKTLVLPNPGRDYEPEAVEEYYAAIDKIFFGEKNSK